MTESLAYMQGRVLAEELCELRRLRDRLRKNLFDNQYTVSSFKKAEARLFVNKITNRGSSPSDSLKRYGCVETQPPVNRDRRHPG